MFESYEDVLDVEETCEVLKIGKNRMYHLLSEREIKGYREGRCWRIPRKSIVEYIEKKSGGE